MPEECDTDALRRQLLIHLRTLKSAGVEWFPVPTAPLAGPVEPGDCQSSIAAATPQACATPAHACGVAAKPAADDRRIALELLAGEVKKCTRCAELCSTRTQTVFGHGQLSPDICFVGEAPGADEDAQGIPFVGAAGQLLNRIIAACGMKREEVYICNILRCRPPGNRTPLPNEAANCRDFLERQLELVQPKFIVALGGCAASNLLGTTVPIGKLRGRFHTFKNIPVMVTYHPAYLLPHRSPDKKREVWEDMKMVLNKLGRPIP